MRRLRDAGLLVRDRLGLGASPSGKAAAFGAAIRRFESCRPSQPVHLKHPVSDRYLNSPAVPGASGKPRCGRPVSSDETARTTSCIRGAPSFLDPCFRQFLFSDLEFNGRQHAVVRVLALRVKEQFDVLEHVRPGGIAGRVRPSPDAPALQAPGHLPNRIPAHRDLMRRAAIELIAVIACPIIRLIGSK